MTIPNDTRLQDGLLRIAELGRDHAKGADSLPRFALEVIGLAADGLLEAFDSKRHRKTQKNPNPEADGATLAYGKYREASSKKAQHTSTGVANHTSETRQLIAASVNPNWDFTVSADKMVKMHERHRKADPKAVKPLWKAFVTAARKQLADEQQGIELNDEQLEACVMADDPKSKDLEAILKPIETSLKKLITGKREDGVQTSDPRIVAAHAGIDSVLGAIAVLREREELADKARELGLVVSDKEDEEDEEIENDSDQLEMLVAAE